ncbi:unnamed protein product [Porites lobata]|uniref:Uncharacterized protein n=1 Tax=Porites lobata TaxID=104759 RepID=A0ABN8S4Y4_9CNID|nr:unnamed protein product [Porites lobata]
MKEGIDMEPRIIERFIKTGNVMGKCGFFISEAHPFLGAKDTLCIPGIYKRNKEKIVLNTNHKYFYQLQQQLFCSKYKQSHLLFQMEFR